MENSCENCRFFDSFEDKEAPNEGYCRRYPPSTPVMEDGGWRWYFAEVETHNWCGEFSNAELTGGAKRRPG